MSRARVDLVSPPMSGHLHPLLGIGRRLARDVDVRVISSGAAQPEIAAAGLAGQPLMAGADELISAIVNPPHAVGSNPWRLYKQFRSNLSMLERFRAELLDLWQEDPPQLVIADFVVPVAGSAALKCGIRWWTTIRSPCAMETPDGPPGYLGGWKPWPGLAGRVRDAAGRAAIRTFKRGVHRLNRETLRRLGFPAVYRPDGYEAIYSADRVLALGLAELEFPRRYPPVLEFVGPALYTPPNDAAPPPFVDGGVHVLVTLGTHVSWRKDAVAAAVLRAARELPGIEFHFSDGHRASQRRESEGNMHRLGFVSYARDLSRYDLVVHHAGAGVVSQTLAAGTPAIVLPVDYDQFDNAARLEVAGVGLRLRRLDDLPRLVTRALGDADMRSRCRRMQALLAAGSAEERVAAMVAETLRARP